MYICEKCNQVYAEQVTLCAICGHDVIKPAVSEPVFVPVSVHPTPDTTTYAYEPEKPQSSGGSKAKGIVGFVMATECFASSLLIMIYSTLLSALVIGYGDDLKSMLNYGYNSMYSVYSSNDLYTALFTYLFMAIAELVLGIVSLSLVSKAKNSGYTSKLTSLGKTFGIIGTVISGVSVFLLFSALINL